MPDASGRRLVSMTETQCGALKALLTHRQHDKHLVALVVAWDAAPVDSAAAVQHELDCYWPEPPPAAAVLASLGFTAHPVSADSADPDLSTGAVATGSGVTTPVAPEAAHTGAPKAAGPRAGETESQNSAGIGAGASNPQTRIPPRTHDHKEGK